MPLQNYPQTACHLANYTVLPCQAPNEVYIPEAEAPDSTAFLIRNNVFIELTWPSEIEAQKERQDPEKVELTSVFFK